MKHIRIDKDTISLKCDGEPYERDQPFSLPVTSIKEIVICNRMIGDEDTDVLVFISKDDTKHSLTINYIVSGLSELYLLLAKAFSIDFDAESSKTVDECRFIYPDNKYALRVDLKKML